MHGLGARRSGRLQRYSGVGGGLSPRTFPRNGVTVKEALRRRLSYANVVATLALFVALGGSSYAALSITGRDVRNGSLTYRDLKRNTLDGSRIAESRLGTVRYARNAARLNGITAARLFVRCPEGTFPVSDVCVEQAARPAAPYRSAAVECEITDRTATPGRRLPSHDELMTALGDAGITLADGGELTRNVYPSAAVPGGLNVLYITSRGGDVAVTTDAFTGAKPFRCVADPLN